MVHARGHKSATILIEDVNLSMVWLKKMFDLIYKLKLKLNFLVQLINKAG